MQETLPSREHLTMTPTKFNEGNVTPGRGSGDKNEAKGQFVGTPESLKHNDQAEKRKTSSKPQPLSVITSNLRSSAGISPLKPGSDGKSAGLSDATSDMSPSSMGTLNSVWLAANSINGIGNFSGLLTPNSGIMNVGSPANGRFNLTNGSSHPLQSPQRLESDGNSLQGSPQAVRQSKGDVREENGRSSAASPSSISFSLSSPSSTNDKADSPSGNMVGSMGSNQSTQQALYSLSLLANLPAMRMANLSATPDNAASKLQSPMKNGTSNGASSPNHPMFSIPSAVGPAGNGLAFSSPLPSMPVSNINTAENVVKGKNNSSNSESLQKEEPVSPQKSSAKSRNTAARFQKITSRNSSSRVAPKNAPQQKEEVFCSSRGVAIIPKEGSNRDAWKPEEDQELIKIVEKMGPKRWTHIARILGTGRSSKQCRERWSNQINPALVRSKWSFDEDKKIIELHSKFGNRWALIAKHLPGRTDNMIKNRFNGSLRIRLKREKLLKERYKNQKDAEGNETENKRNDSSVKKIKSSHPSSRKRPKSKSNTEKKKRKVAPTTTPPPRHAKVNTNSLSPTIKDKRGLDKKNLELDWKTIPFSLRSGSQGNIYWHKVKQLVTLCPPQRDGRSMGLFRLSEAKEPVPSQDLINKLVLSISTPEDEANEIAGWMAEVAGARSQAHASAATPLGDSKKIQGDQTKPIVSRKSVDEQPNQDSASIDSETSNLNIKHGDRIAHPAWEVNWPVSTSPCRCRKSKCLKLYCECFASEHHCSDFCQCTKCSNVHDNREWRTAYLRCITRTPGIFGKKRADLTCKCKSTRCLKKYCDCFRAGAPCGNDCRCVNCLNKPDSFMMNK